RLDDQLVLGLVEQVGEVQQILNALECEDVVAVDVVVHGGVADLVGDVAHLAEVGEQNVFSLVDDGPAGDLKGGGLVDRIEGGGVEFVGVFGGLLPKV